MIENISHITFIVSDLDKSTNLFKEIFDAEEVYYSGNNKHSLYKNAFYNRKSVDCLNGR